MSHPRCPVCWRYARQTLRGNIAGHMDTAGKPCLASGYPYVITLAAS